MRINFFEEYPTKENLSKLDLVNWPSTVFIAASSMFEFESIQINHKDKYPHITFGWWPLIHGSYWVSGFSDSSELEILFKSILSKKQESMLPVLLDLELPRRVFFLKNIFYINKNKRKLRDFLIQAEQLNLKVYTAEYPSPNAWILRLWGLLGVSASMGLPHIRLPMCYSSMISKSFGKKTWNKVKKFEKSFAQLNPKFLSVGIGTIATGVFGNEPILPPEGLYKDLEWAKSTGTDEIFIFRLGGLNKEYISVIKEFEN